jgi:hypothetical protein
MLIHDINIDEKYSNSDFDFDDGEQLQAENLEAKPVEEKKKTEKQD